MQSNTITPPAYLGQWGVSSETAEEEAQEQEALSSDLNIETELNVTQISLTDRRQIAKIVALILRPDSGEEKWSSDYLTGFITFLQLDSSEFHTLSPLIGSSSAQCSAAVTSLNWQTLPLRTKFLLLVLHYSITGNKDGMYDARARCLLRQLCAYLNVPWTWFESQELRYAYAIKRAAMEGKNDLQETANKSKRSRYLKIAGAGLVGGVLLAVTGGLAAPAVAAGIGALSVGTAGAIFAGGTGIVVITSLFGVAGAGLVSRKMKRRVQGLQEFEFDLVRGSTEARALTVTLGVDGWLSPEDIKLQQTESVRATPTAANAKTVSPSRENSSVTWQFLSQRSTEAYTLRWESEALGAFGNALQTFTSNQIKGALKSVAFTQVVKETVLHAVAAALTWPSLLLGLADVIDNPWSIVMSQSAKAAISLADVLEERMAGNRPVSIIAYSMGARVVFLALEELARRSTLSPSAAAALAASDIVPVPPPSPAAVAVVNAAVHHGSPPALDISDAKTTGTTPTPAIATSTRDANAPLSPFERGVCWSCGAKGCRDANNASHAPVTDATAASTPAMTSKTIATTSTTTSSTTTASASAATSTSISTPTTRPPYKGLILDVLLLGTPVEADEERWAKVRGVVAGRLIHCYSASDMVLRFLYRASQATLSVAALQKINVRGVENYDLDLSSHLEYKANVEKAALSVNFFTFCCEKSIGGAKAEDATHSH